MLFRSSRLPLYVLQSDGSIQNKYTLKILNKTTLDLKVKISAKGIDNLILIGADNIVLAKHSTVTSKTVFVKVPKSSLKHKNQPIIFTIETHSETETFKSERENTFMSPDH